MESQPIIELIKNGDPETMKLLYKHKEKFVGYATTSHKCNALDAEEIFQDAVTILWQNVRNEKVVEFENKPQTYLYAVANNLLKAKFSKKKDSHPDETWWSNLKLETETKQSESLTYNRELINRLFKDLGEVCKSVLTFFFFDRFTMESIANNLGFKNEGVAKKKKYQCLKKLKDEAVKLNLKIDQIL